MASLSTSELKKSIEAILKGADLNTLSSKKVRKKLEEQYDADFSERKEEIDEIVMALITADENDHKSENEDAKSEGAESEEEEERKVSDHESSPLNSESEEEKKPPPKKSKPAAKKNSKKEVKNDKITSEDASVKSDMDDDDDVDDEALARKLQEEERNSRSRAVKKSVAKKESSKKKTKEDKPKGRKGGTYSRKCVLSADLANVVGSNEMARHDVVKTMWTIVRERDLFDPRNKQFALCDEQLQKVFGKKRIRMFGMMKYLKNHIKDPH